MPDIVSFTLLDTRDFCPPTNLLELSSGLQLTYLGAIWSFRVVLLWYIFLDGPRVVLALGLIGLLFQGKILSAFTHFLWITGFLSLTFGSRHCSQPCVHDRYYSPNPVGDPFLDLGVFFCLFVFNMHMLTCTLLFCPVNSRCIDLTRLISFP